MLPVDRIRDLILSRYNAGPSLRESLVEQGCVLFDRAGGVQLPDQLLKGASHSSIQLYGGQGGLRVGLDVITDHMAGRNQYLGDYHTHVEAGYYPPELPSPHDLFEWGATCDLCPLWRLWPSLRTVPDLKPVSELDSLPVAPRIQFVQIARYGDIIQIERTASRSAFADLSAQDNALKPLRDAYDQHLKSAGDGISVHRDKSDYRSLIRKWITDANGIVCSRVKLTYFENPASP